MGEKGTHVKTHLHNFWDVMGLFTKAMVCTMFAAVIIVDH